MRSRASLRAQPNAQTGLPVDLTSRAHRSRKETRTAAPASCEWIPEWGSGRKLRPHRQQAIERSIRGRDRSTWILLPATRITQRPYLESCEGRLAEFYAARRRPESWTCRAQPSLSGRDDIERPARQTAVGRRKERRKKPVKKGV